MKRKRKINNYLNIQSIFTLYWSKRVGGARGRGVGSLDIHFGQRGNTYLVYQPLIKYFNC